MNLSIYLLLWQTLLSEHHLLVERTAIQVVVEEKQINLEKAAENFPIIKVNSIWAQDRSESTESNINENWIKFWNGFSSFSIFSLSLENLFLYTLRYISKCYNRIKTWKKGNIHHSPINIVDFLEIAYSDPVPKWYGSDERRSYFDFLW